MRGADTGFSARRWGLGIAILAAAGLGLGCRQDMHDQPKIEPFEEHAFFDDGLGSRPVPAGTVARGFLNEDPHRFEGKDEAGNFVDLLPAGMTVDRAFLEHGRERYEIYCSPCHDSVGSGRGMIVRRGFKQPPPLYEARLFNMPLGYFYDVMTQGFGAMSSYAKMIPVEDRWAISAYIRVIQNSQQSILWVLPAEMQEEFNEAMAAKEAALVEAEGSGPASLGGDEHAEEGGP